MTYTRNDRVKEFAKIYSSKSDTELIYIQHTKVNTCDEFIAATQIIAERRTKTEQDRHSVLVGKIDALKKPHWTVNPNFWFTVGGAIAGAIAAYYAVRADLKLPENYAAKPLPAISPKEPTPIATQPAPSKAPEAASTLPPPKQAPADIPAIPPKKEEPKPQQK